MPIIDSPQRQVRYRLAGRSPQRQLRWTAIALAIGFALHALDHVHRGMAAATMLVMIGGAAEAVSIAIAVTMVLTHRKWAAQAAIVVGFGSALASTYGHLLPTFLPGLQDSFVSSPHIGVTWFSWVSLAAAMGAGILFGFAGIRAARDLPPAGPATHERQRPRP